MQHKVSWLKSFIKKHKSCPVAILASLLVMTSCLHAMDSTSLADDALMVSILAKNVDGVCDALKQSVQINLRNNKYANHTPLSEAVATGNEAIVGLLLDYPGIDIDIKLENDWSALHIAAHHKSSGIVRLLVKHGAQLNMVNVDGRTPLHEAVYQCDPQSVCALVTQIPQRKLYAYAGRIALPLLCCFNRFANGDGVPVAIPREIQLLLCRYALKAHVPDIAEAQLKLLQAVLEHKDSSKNKPWACAVGRLHLPTWSWDSSRLLFPEVDSIRCPMINNHIWYEIDQLNLASKPHSLEKLQTPPTSDTE